MKKRLCTILMLLLVLVGCVKKTDSSTDPVDQTRPLSKEETVQALLANGFTFSSDNTLRKYDQENKLEVVLDFSETSNHTLSLITSITGMKYKDYTYDVTYVLDLSAKEPNAYVILESGVIVYANCYYAPLGSASDFIAENREACDEDLQKFVADIQDNIVPSVLSNGGVTLADVSQGGDYLSSFISNSLVNISDTDKTAIIQTIDTLLSKGYLINYETGSLDKSSAQEKHSYYLNSLVDKRLVILVYEGEAVYAKLVLSETFAWVDLFDDSETIVESCQYYYDSTALIEDPGTQICQEESYDLVQEIRETILFDTGLAWADLFMPYEYLEVYKLYK